MKTDFLGVSKENPAFQQGLQWYFKFRCFLGEKTTLGLLFRVIGINSSTDESYLSITFPWALYFSRY